MKFKSLILFVVSLFLLLSCELHTKFENPLDPNNIESHSNDVDAETDDKDSDATDTVDDEKTDTVSTNDDKEPAESTDDDTYTSDTSIPDNDQDTDSEDSTPDEDADIPSENDDDSDISDFTDDADLQSDDDADSDSDNDIEINPIYSKFIGRWAAKTILASMKNRASLDITSNITTRYAIVDFYINDKNQLDMKKVDNKLCRTDSIYGNNVWPSMTFNEPYSKFNTIFHHWKPYNIPGQEDNPYVEVAENNGKTSFKLNRDWELRGANMVEPASETMISDTNDSRIFDHDEDGKPAFTIRVNGIITGEIYYVDRLSQIFIGELVEDGKIEGNIEWKDEQFIHSSTNTTLQEEEKTIPKSDKSVFQFVKVADNMNCDTMLDQINTIFDLVEPNADDMIEEISATIKEIQGGTKEKGDIVKIENATVISPVISKNYDDSTVYTFYASDGTTSDYSGLYIYHLSADTAPVKGDKVTIEGKIEYYAGQWEIKAANIADSVTKTGTGIVPSAVEKAVAGLSDQDKGTYIKITDKLTVESVDEYSIVSFTNGLTARGFNFTLSLTAGNKIKISGIYDTIFNKNGFYIIDADDVILQ